MSSQGLPGKNQCEPPKNLPVMQIEDFRTRRERAGKKG
jgi:hypothetical protein